MFSGKWREKQQRSGGTVGRRASGLRGQGQCGVQGSLAEAHPWRGKGVPEARAGVSLAHSDREADQDWGETREGEERALFLIGSVSNQ